MRALSEFQVRNAFRERDEFDINVLPDSVRASVLRLYDERDRVISAIEASIRAAPWYKRLWMKPLYRALYWWHSR